VARIFVIWGLVVKPLSLKSIAKILGWDCTNGIVPKKASFGHSSVCQEKEQRADSLKGFPPVA